MQSKEVIILKEKNFERYKQLGELHDYKYYVQIVI